MSTKEGELSAIPDLPIDKLEKAISRGIREGFEYWPDAPNRELLEYSDDFRKEIIDALLNGITPDEYKNVWEERGPKS